MNTRITQQRQVAKQEAERLLEIMLDDAKEKINRFLDSQNLKADQNTFDALTDLFYNRNSNDLTQEIALAMAQNDIQKVLRLFQDFDYRYALKYLYQNDTSKAQAYVNRNPGLARRRNEEYSIFINGVKNILR